jgi:hypothetical protein
MILPIMSERDNLDADSTIEIVPLDEVQLIDIPLEEFDGVADERVAFFVSPALCPMVGRAAETAPQRAPWRAWSDTAVAFGRVLVTRARAAFLRLGSGPARWASSIQVVMSRAVRQATVLAADLAERKRSRVLVTRMSVEEIARLNIIAASCGSSASVVVRTLVHREYQRLTGRRRFG